MGGVVLQSSVKFASHANQLLYRLFNTSGVFELTDYYYFDVFYLPLGFGSGISLHQYFQMGSKNSADVPDKASLYSEISTWSLPCASG